MSLCLYLCLRLFLNKFMFMFVFMIVFVIVGRFAVLLASVFVFVEVDFVCI